MGRPKKKIDTEQVRKLAEKQWSDAQIGAFLGIHQTNLRRRFAMILDESRHSGKAKLIDVLWQRGVIEKSDKILTHLADRFLGPIPKKIQITREQAIEVLEQDLQQRGLESPTTPPAIEAIDDIEF